MKLLLLASRTGSKTPSSGLLQRYYYSSKVNNVAQRSKHMSTMPQAASVPNEESHFALILGKPGGGKGTISGKILKVCSVVLLCACMVVKLPNLNDKFLTKKTIV